ncbi:MAG: flagellar basal body rod protein FlgB [Bacillota bacterium]
MQRVGLLWNAADSSLALALDAAALRQEAIAHNLANVETPRYRRFDVVYEEALRAQQAERERRKVDVVRTHPAHLPVAGGKPVQPVLVRDTTSLVRNDRSNVDIEREMVALSKNTLFYQTVTTVLGTRFAALRTAISEGRR